MKIETMPKETASELLIFLSENEDFGSVSKLIGEGLEVQEVRALLREVGDELRREAFAENKTDYDVKKCAHLSRNSKRIISYLSPREEQKLLTVFGLVDKKGK